MHLRTWLTIAALTTALGCGDDSGGDSVASKEETRNAALALTEAVNFENGISRVGAIPDATAESITLIPDGESIVLVPGDSAVMTMGFENPDEDKDPVDSVLLQFSDSDDHIEVPRMAGDAGVGDAGAGDNEIKMPFSIDDKVCDQLCDKVFNLSVIQAVHLKRGEVSKHKTRSFDLDCSKSGDHKMCAAVKGDSAAGAGSGTTKGTGGGTSGTGGTGGSAGKPRTVADTFATALITFDTTLCTCAGAPAGMETFCPQAAVTGDQKNCLTTFVTANLAAVKSSLNCVIGELSKCDTACDPVACDPAQLRNFPAACSALPADLQADYTACLPSKDVAPPRAGGAAPPAP